MSVEDELRQVDANLVTNALVHSGPSAEVGIRIERRDDVAVVSVIDDGSGMTTEHAARAFDRFWRRVLPGRSAANPQESKKRRAGSRR